MPKDGGIGNWEAFCLREDEDLMQIRGMSEFGVRQGQEVCLRHTSGLPAGAA